MLSTKNLRLIPFPIIKTERFTEHAMQRPEGSSETGLSRFQNKANSFESRPLHFIVSPSCIRERQFLIQKLARSNRWGAHPRTTVPKRRRSEFRSDMRHTGTTPTDQEQPKGTPNETPAPSSESFASFRNLRKLMTVLSLTGAIEASYLTYNKLFSSPGAICSTQGCLDVLSGPFSTFLGVPLTLFGALAYTGFAYLCIWPLAAQEEEAEAQNAEPVIVSAEEVYAVRDAATRPLMLAVSSAMFSFSAYLMSLLTLVVRSLCPYCVLSAVLSTLLFILTAFVGKAVPKLKTAFKIVAASISAASVCAAMSFFLAMPAHLRAQGSDFPQAPPEITMSSDRDAIRTAEKLARKKTRMYGAYWCAHCYDQKQRLGKQAFSRIPYVECDKNGVDSQYKLCREKRIPGYPTWEIGGELYPGEIEISELERLADEAQKK